MMKSASISLAVGVIVGSALVSGCATVHKSTPIPKGEIISVELQSGLPDSDYLPEQSAIVPGTNYVVIQAQGGSILLGPIMGSMNISAKTQRMAEQYKDKYLGVDVSSVVERSLDEKLKSESGSARVKLRPFVFVQHCYDDKFRLSLVYHVEGSHGSGESWVGRYIRHLKGAISSSDFAQPTAAELAAYIGEIEAAAEELTALLKRDLAGQLPEKGRRASVGSLYIIGNRMGGMGIYTEAEKLHFKGAEVIEENDARVLVRIDGNMHATGLFGGMAFGLHSFLPSQLHTLEYDLEEPVR